MARIAILHPTDPFGHVPGGIDSFIKGVLKWAPAGLDYTLIGATSDPKERPIGRPARVSIQGGRHATHVPIVFAEASSVRGALPLSLRYVLALSRHIRRGALNDFDILDFHRIEPALLFGSDERPKNAVLHADYAILRDKSSDIMWRHWPWLYERLEARAFRRLRRVFVVRRSAVERYARLYPELRRKFSFIPTWMDADTFHPAATSAERLALKERLGRSLGVPSTARWLVFVGRLDSQKDPLLLLAAFRNVQRSNPDAHLLIIGDGTLRPEVERMRRAENLGDRVKLLGARPATEIGQVLRSADLFVLSSAYEGMSIAVLEALACGMPVVSTNVGEIDLVLTDGINGYVSKERSPDHLADAVRRALGRLEQLRGAPCTDAVAAYKPERVLKTIYDNHRRQLDSAGGRAVKAHTYSVRG